MPKDKDTKKKEASERQAKYEAIPLEKRLKNAHGKNERKKLEMKIREQEQAQKT